MACTDDSICWVLTHKYTLQIQAKLACPAYLKISAGMCSKSESACLSSVSLLREKKKNQLMGAGKIILPSALQRLTHQIYHPWALSGTVATLLPTSGHSRLVCIMNNEMCSLAIKAVSDNHQAMYVYNYAHTTGPSWIAALKISFKATFLKFFSFTWAKAYKKE